VKPNLHRVIGIDLGTTYSACAMYDTFTTQAELVLNPDDAGTETVPSVVSYDPVSGCVTVGTHAKRNLANDPMNTILEIKREMGEYFSPDTLSKYGAEGLFRARTPQGVGGDPVRVKLGPDWYQPQEISAFILMKMKAIAEAEIGEEIRDAVVTVPAHFTEPQKAATKEAALLAGLYPRQILPEPTAAAVCYGLDRFEPVRKVYLVYDLGGGTFDVSIISVEQDRIDVLATSGNRRLGGGDFDDAIVAWALEQLRTQHGVAEVPPDVRARLKDRAEWAKIGLSTFPSTKIPVSDLLPTTARVENLELTRETFTELIDKRYLLPSLNKVDDAVQFAEQAKGLRREEIDGILLVGGSSKIPRVRERLLDYFGKDPDFVRADLNPDTVVARGAAALAHRFQPSPPPFDVRSQGSGLMNAEADLPQGGMITEHTLGVEVQDHLFSRILERGTNIPVSKREDGYANAGPTTDVEVHVFQGEDDDCRRNAEIGVIHLGPMEPMPAGHHQFAVTFSIDENGLLSVTVHHLNENRDIHERFEQPTGVGGVEALATLRQKLLGMFAATMPATEPPPPRPASAAPVGEPSAVPPPVPAPPTPAAASGEAGSARSLPSPEAAVPDEFKSVYRRASKLLLQRNDPSLFTSLQAFVAALDASVPEETLIDLADGLEDAYHDARLHTTG
jgi:molecular chaperone DnaK (HSP70)